MRKIGISMLLLCFVMGNVKAQEEQTAGVLRKIADRIVENTSYKFIDTKTKKEYENLKGVPYSRYMKAKSSYNDWHYTDGILDMAMLELSDELKDSQYEKYVKDNMDFVFNTDNLNYFKNQYETVLKEKDGLKNVSHLTWVMFFRMVRLDDYGTMAAALIDLYQRGDQKSAYMDYVKKSAHTLEFAEPRLIDGTIARYFPRKMTIWADDLYMSVSLLARMGKLTGQNKYFDDAIHQVLQFHEYLWNAGKGLYYHSYYTDNETNGVAFWARNNGWVMMAQADLLDKLPENYPGRDKVLNQFKEQAEYIARYQSPNGLWHQLLDKTDSYLETSASAIFTYCLAKGVNEGWLHPDFSQVAANGWKGVLSNVSEDGDVSDICPGTGIAPSLVFYYTRPRVKNIAMGEGPVIRAGVEIMKMKPYHETPAYETYHLVKDRSKN